MSEPRWIEGDPIALGDDDDESESLDEPDEMYEEMFNN